MPRSYPPEVRRQVVELARSGTKVAQLVATCAMSEATVYNWLRQEQIDRGEVSGTSTDMALDLARGVHLLGRNAGCAEFCRRIEFVHPTGFVPLSGATRSAAGYPNTPVYMLTPMAHMDFGKRLRKQMLTNEA